MGKLTDKAIESICFGPIENGKRRGEYRRYRLEGTEWNTDNECMVDTEGRMKRKYADGGSMYLTLANTGAKSFHFDYSYPRGGKRKTISLGRYPETSLAEARGKLLEAKRLLAQGIDPSQDRKERIEAVKQEVARQTDTFEKVACEWHKLKCSHIAMAKEVLRKLERDVFPRIGCKAIADITRDDVVSILREIETRGATSTSHAVYRIIYRVMDYALVLGKVSANVAQSLSTVLQGHETRHYAKITDPAMLGAYLRDMESDTAVRSFIPEIRQFLCILPYVFTRPIELAGARWSEIDFEKALWTLPAGRMKKRRVHIVPLATQVASLFREMLPLTGNRDHVFFSARTKTGHIATGDLVGRLRGFEGECRYGREDFTLHGFRGVASTMLHEQGYRSEWIEIQLAHVDRNAVRASYNSAEYLEDRRRMMQAWADYLDGLKKNSKE